VSERKDVSIINMIDGVREEDYDRTLSNERIASATKRKRARKYCEHEDVSMCKEGIDVQESITKVLSGA
jgi:hypothetical protein